MPCARYEEIILEYCEGSLGAEERSRVEAHLAGCPECRSFCETLVELEAALAGAIGKPMPSPAFRQNLMRRVEAGPRARFGRVLRLLDAIGYASVAAIGGIVLSVVVPPEYAAWVGVGAYAMAGAWLGIYVLREGRLPGQR